LFVISGASLTEFRHFFNGVQLPRRHENAALMPTNNAERTGSGCSGFHRVSKAVKMAGVEAGTGVGAVIVAWPDFNAGI